MSGETDAFSHLSNDVPIVLPSQSSVRQLSGFDSMTTGRDQYEANTRDSLTGAMNRYALEDTLHREIARAVRSQSELSVMVLVVDSFAEDEVLVEVGHRLMKHCREDDFVARLAQDRFCVVLASTSQSDAKATARHLRQVMLQCTRKAAADRTPFDGKIEAKIGIATLNPASPISVSSLLAQAQTDTC